jgi:pimeloyl-ACP methyl ester carboxylesterase
MLVAVDSRFTVEAAEKLPGFDRPVLLAWAPEDRFFPLDHARRLAELLPNAHVEEVPDSLTFVCEDQPERVAQLVSDFASQASAVTAAS